MDEYEIEIPEDGDWDIGKHYESVIDYNPNVQSASQREIQYRDEKPVPFITQVSLREYFEKIKRYRADKWQKDLCDRLQKAVENRHLARTWLLIHAEGQLGKTTIISQCFPSWIFGHIPTFRFALAMYNKTKSEQHSQIVIDILDSSIHKDIFPNKDGWLHHEESNFGKRVSKSGWMTAARREVGDGQLSFNPVGLRAGLTGSGFDWLGIDDPYRDQKDAFSQVINQGLRDWYDYTLQSRIGLHSCISGMFHRYAPEDFAGYMLDTNDFDYVRYATQYDGPYIHEKSGRIFTDPIGRAVGQYISPERRPPHYYDKARKNNRVWYSMFQGRPSAEEGEFFNVGKITEISREEAEEREKDCLAIVRSYDLASSVEEHAAYSVGVKMGIRANGRITIFDMWRERVDTAVRTKKQQEIAQKDGPGVKITVPIDPGQAGATTVFFLQQLLKDYTVEGVPTSGSKEERALNFSVAVNDGLVEMVKSEKPKDGDDDWNVELKKELRDFPLSDWKDITDACADAYNTLFRDWTRGTVVKNYKWNRNFIRVSEFLRKFGNLKSGIQNGDPVTLSHSEFTLPPKFAVYAAVKINNDASKPTSAVIAARAPAFSDCPESLFVLDEYKRYDANMYALFEWLEASLARWKTAEEPLIWLHPDSEQYHQTICDKMPYKVSMFKEDNLAGHEELNWYLKGTDDRHPFDRNTESAHLYFVSDDKYFYGATLADADAPQSFYHARQEIQTWGFNDRGEPTEIGQVIDCLRMLCYRFRTYAETYTKDEEIELTVKKYFPYDLQKIREEGSMTHSLQYRMRAAKFLAKLDLEEKHGKGFLEEDKENEDDFLWFIPKD
jgi:predicted phage terminase large subunit-like protein